MKRRNPGALAAAGVEKALAGKRCNSRAIHKTKQMEKLFAVLRRWRIELEDVERAAHPTIYNSPEWDRVYGGGYERHLL